MRPPSRAARMTAFAERFVLSIRSECLDRIVPLSEAHPRRCVSEYVQHYHAERNHPGQRVDRGLAGPANTNGRVERSERLGLLT
jgi:hypothetical protein